MTGTGGTIRCRTTPASVRSSPTSPSVRVDEFSYLTVLLSIVLGLGLTRLLTGLGHQIEMRGQVRSYWPALVWALVLVLVHVQTWWTMFGLRGHAGWTFLAFLVVLLQPVVLFLLAVLVLPTLTPGVPVDLRAHYFAQSRWFFALFGVLLAVSLAKDLVLSGSLPDVANVGFHLAFLALAAAAGATRREGVHRAVAVTSVGLLGVYIAVLFSQLT